MADTNLSSVIVPEVFAPYTLDMALQSNALILSGAVNTDGLLTTLLAGGGQTFNYPSWGTIEAGLSYDTPTSNSADVASALSVSGKNQVAVRIAGTKTWNEMLLASQLAGSKPLDAVAATVARAVNTARQAALVSQLNGLFATALSASVSDIAVEDGVNATSTQVFNKDTFINATAPFGDFLADGAIIVCHSDVYRKMQSESAITTNFIPVGDSTIALPNYLGHPVVVDDSVGKIAGATSGFKYNTYIMRPGAIKMGNGSLSTILHSEPMQGNGAGAEYFILRDAFAYHMLGTAFTSASVAGATPTNAELATGSNWSKVLETKQIPAVKLVTN